MTRFPAPMKKHPESIAETLATKGVEEGEWLYLVVNGITPRTSPMYLRDFKVKDKKLPEGTIVKVVARKGAGDTTCC